MKIEQPCFNAERERCLAAYYALYLRIVERYSPDEAAAFVKRRYPGVRVPDLKAAGVP